MGWCAAFARDARRRQRNRKVRQFQELKSAPRSSRTGGFEVTVRAGRAELLVERLGRGRRRGSRVRIACKSVVFRQRGAELPRRFVCGLLEMQKYQRTDEAENAAPQAGFWQAADGTR